jgi:hypothetical protein
VTVNPGGGAGWDESPLDIQIPDDARELDRDVLAYHRELRAKRRRRRLRRLAGPLAGQGAMMPLLASILAVCLVAGAMLSVATFNPATNPTAPTQRTHPSAPAASTSPPATPQASATASGTSTAARPATTTGRGTARATATGNSTASPLRSSDSTPAVPQTPRQPGAG